MSLTALANPFQGTDSRHEFSKGNTYPAIGVPRGLTYWAPQTSDTNGFFFEQSVSKLAGFRATHCPSPWMGDYGHFDVMPVTGPIGASPGARASGCQWGEVNPVVARVKLLRYGIEAGLTATRACGVMQFVFPPDSGQAASIVIQTGKAHHTHGELAIRSEDGRSVVYGKAMSHQGGVPEGFACYFVAEVVGAEVMGTGSLVGEAATEGGKEARGTRAGVWLTLGAVSTPVTVRVATSFVSFEQALANLEREVGDKSFDQVVEAATALWDKWLGKVEVVSGDEIQRRTLYSCLYRVGLWPMAMHEFDAAGHAVHYSPYNGQVQPGVAYTNNGFWDTYRTVYPLLGLIDREGFGEIVQGFLQAYRDGGWLPKWCSPGYRDCMIGSHADAVISEAVLRDIPGFDVNEAYAAIRKNAFEPVEGGGGRYGRAALTHYDRLGYVPDELAHASVSWTQDNAHCDWCIAQVALKVGAKDDAKRLLERSQSYKNLWDPETRFFRAKISDGSWARPWREFEWGYAYVEGGPWQFRFHAPHDPKGLAELFGGTDALMAELDRMFATPARFEAGSYGFEIHEMTEMAVAVDADEESFGQYAQSNQPVHAFLYVAAALGKTEWASKQVARVMRGLYSPDVFPADEDNGEMSAWYVLAALGEGAACAGSGKTVRVRPWEHGAIRARVAGR